MHDWIIRVVHYKMPFMNSEFSLDFHQPPSRPVFGRNVYVASTATVCGNVIIGDECSLWPGVAIRGDVSQIRIGCRVNFQDGTVVHTKNSVDLVIEDDVSFGHGAIAHCKRIGRGSLIGIGAIVLDDCEIGEQCLIGSGSVVPPGKIIPDGKLVLGIPGKIARDLTDEEREYLRLVTANYVELARKHLRGDYPITFPK